MYADYYAIDAHLFSLNQVGCSDSQGAWNKAVFKRTVKVSLDPFPCDLPLGSPADNVGRPLCPSFPQETSCYPVHRAPYRCLHCVSTSLASFAKGSEMCRRLGEEISYQIQQEAELFDFRQSHDVQPLMLVRALSEPLCPLHRRGTALGST
jgi:hypothetical protein